ncbi:hypothetical protein [Paenibacillus woosongensis]|uniref:Uncharacterized protein n=1 Tax=Paenibacillus woosongensis TaxID=307580 RepID=A0ABQ4MYZ8_9BACL|nr:hypothetical protein [Paenibacillus woosongensis]GIP61155.1 hypothetical protein J15TS10_49690 [Paenibacillus woosongensis]
MEVLEMSYISLNEKLRLVDIEASNSWKALVYIFVNHPKLYKRSISMESVINTNLLIRQSEGWNNSERILLNLALFLFDSYPDYDLNEVKDLTGRSLEVALNALEIYFGIRDIYDLLSENAAS